MIRTQNISGTIDKADEPACEYVDHENHYINDDNDNVAIATRGVGRNP